MNLSSVHGIMLLARGIVHWLNDIMHAQGSVLTTLCHAHNEFYVDLYIWLLFLDVEKAKMHEKYKEGINGSIISFIEKG